MTLDAILLGIAIGALGMAVFVVGLVALFFRAAADSIKRGLS